MPVLSVKAVSELVTSGALDGRVVAVAGYVHYTVMFCSTVWLPTFLGMNCDHPVLLEHDDLDRPGPGFRIAFTPEASGGQLAPRTDTLHNGGYPVVLIGHGADIRSYQCQAGEGVAECADIFAVDRVAWLDGHVVGLIPGSLDPSPSWIPTEVDERGAIALSASPSAYGALGQFDPRLNGMSGGTAWFARYVTGTPGADGAFSSDERVYDDATHTLLKTLPTSAPADYAPSHVNVFPDYAPEVLPFVDGDRVRVDVTADGAPVASDRVDWKTNGPIVVAPGSYSLDVYLVNQPSTSEPVSEDVGYPHCATDVSVEANGFASIDAAFGEDACAVTDHQGEL
jgi:hypothetical protein